MKTYRVEINDAGTKRWYKPGTDDLHREDGPAIEWANGDCTWIKNGVIHRVGGPAVMEFGNEAWYQDGLRHREDGPAVEYANGDKEWWIDGKRHRTDGPAVVWVAGAEFWYVNGESLTEEKFNLLAKFSKFF